MIRNPPGLARPLTSTRLRFSAGAWWALFLGGLLLYGLTANRGVQWQDSGLHILRVVQQQVDHPLGLALAHPLHHGLGRVMAAIGLFEPPFAVTLVSAIAGALCIANVYGAVVMLTDKHLAGVFAALSLGLANTFWQLSTLAESYTLCAALLAAEIWCLAGFVRTSKNPWLYGMALFNGLGIANHMLASLTTPVVVVVALTHLMRRQRPGGPALTAAGLWLLGTLPYTLLILRTWSASGDFSGTMHSALFGEYASNVLNASPASRQLLITLAFPLYNFPNLLLPAALYGLLRWRVAGVPRASARALLAGLVIHLLFVMRYSIVDQQTFFLPVYVYLAIFGGIGAGVVLSWMHVAARRKLIAVAAVLLVLTPVVYAIAPSLARRAQVLERTIGLRQKPYRDDYRYLLVPWSVAETSAERMSAQAVAMAGERGVVFYEDPMARFALEYKARHLDRDGMMLDRDGMMLIELPAKLDAEERATFEQIILLTVDEGRPVVLVPRRTDTAPVEPPIGDWKKEGDLYRLIAASPSK